MATRRLSRRQFIWGSSAAVAGASISSQTRVQARSSRPNIVLILVDDLGFGDLGCYGNTFCDTPNIDRLAAQGLRFTNAYAAAPICSASRAALLTGKTPARLNFEFVTKNDDDYEKDWADRYTDKTLIPPVYTLNLPTEEVTIADALKDAGYDTGITGKWHVSAHHEHYLGWSPTHGPQTQGFDWGTEDFGAHPYGYDKSETGRFGPYNEGEFPEDTLTQNAIEFMERERTNPFFLMVSHYHVHTPLGTRCKWLIDKYVKRAGGDPKDKRAVYGAFVETLDHYVGQLLNAMDRLDLTRDTIVMFTSDNGGHPQFAFNSPLRGSKWNLYEGGVRVPTIIRWPGVTPKGKPSSTPMHGADIMPTCCDIAGTHLPDTESIDGQNILALLRGSTNNDLMNRDLVWHFPYYHPERNYAKQKAEIGIDDGYVSQTQPQSSIRRGRYKLIHFYESGRNELYDLYADTSEQLDISRSSPYITQELESALFRYLWDVGARFPQPNRNYAP